MPNYTFKCNVCSEEVTHYMTYTEMKETVVICPNAAIHHSGSNVMERVLRATSTAIQTKEIIDNGLQVKKVERLAGVVEMIRERADDNDKS